VPSNPEFDIVCSFLSPKAQSSLLNLLILGGSDGDRTPRLDLSCEPPDEANPPMGGNRRNPLCADLTPARACRHKHVKTSGPFGYLHRPPAFGLAVKLLSGFPARNCVGEWARYFMVEEPGFSLL